MNISTIDILVQTFKRIAKSTKVDISLDLVEIHAMDLAKL